MTCWIKTRKHLSATEEADRAWAGAAGTAPPISCNFESNLKKTPKLTDDQIISEKRSETA